MKIRLNLKLAVIILFLLGGLIFVLRFLLGGNEDTWICSEGEWIKHGNPSKPSPTEICK